MAETKTAFLLLLNLALAGVTLWAGYIGELTAIWHADALKLSFVIIPAYFLTAFALTFGWIAEDTADMIEGRLPMIALCGTVYGILSVFNVLGQAKLGGAGDFKALIGPLLQGGGTAMWPTFLALAASNLIWLHLVVMRWGRADG